VHLNEREKKRNPLKGKLDILIALTNNKEREREDITGANEQYLSAVKRCQAGHGQKQLKKKGQTG